VWPEFKARVQADYQAPSRAIARWRAARGKQISMALMMIAHLRFPVTHRRAIRTTNLLERLFVEERRRLKIIPNAFGERAVLKLMFAPRRRTMALSQSQRVRTPAAGGGQERARSGIQGHGRPRCKALKGWKPPPENPAALGLDRFCRIVLAQAGVTVPSKNREDFIARPLFPAGESPENYKPKSAHFCGLRTPPKMLNGRA
jgi:Transposase, Mutator family